MKSLKKLLMFLGMVSCGSFVFSSQKPKTCWQSFTGCFRPQPRECSGATPFYSESGPTQSINLAGVPEDVVLSVDRINPLNLRQYRPDHSIQPFRNQDYPEVHRILSPDGLDEVCLFNSKNPFHFVYRQGGIIKGVCAITPRDKQVELLAVRPEFRGEGIGRKLLLEGMHRLRSSDPSTHQITLESTGSALLFYKKCGFEVKRKKGRWMCELDF